MFHKLVAENFTVLPVTGGHFRTAAKFVDQQSLGLRAGDALAISLDLASCFAGNVTGNHVIDRIAQNRRSF